MSINSCGLNGIPYNPTRGVRSLGPFSIRRDLVWVFIGSAAANWNVVLCYITLFCFSLFLFNVVKYCCQVARGMGRECWSLGCGLPWKIWGGMPFYGNFWFQLYPTICASILIYICFEVHFTSVIPRRCDDPESYKIETSIQI